nr:MAG TPA: hypothetical protein [Microviridae sp.]
MLFQKPYFIFVPLKKNEYKLSSKSSCTRLV